jgi:predicted small lipoprotein YifL
MMLAVVALMLAACGGGAPSATPEADASVDPTAVTEPTTEASADAASSDTPTDEPTEEPTPEPTEESTPEPTPSEPSSGGASACAGTAENQDFYAVFAAAVDWTVYCPVLPKGWFVESGQYRLAGGGRMEIGYRGPDGARFTLQEGAFCSDADGCVPDGTELGSASLAGLDGTLVSGDDGSWAIVVDPGANPSWLIVGTGIDEEAFRTIAADLAPVAP